MDPREQVIDQQWVVGHKKHEKAQELDRLNPEAFTQEVSSD